MNLPTGPFKTILADPAWSYNNTGVEGAAATEYATMPLEDIKALPVRDVADKNAVLLLWATNPLLPDALEVMAAWGFTYKSGLTWCKNTFGTGFWVRGKTEHLLIGTKGKPPIPTKAPASAISLDNPGHSAKPRGFYPIYEALGQGPRLEMFARQRRDGWTAWGNQLSATVETAFSIEADKGSSLTRFGSNPL